MRRGTPAAIMFGRSLLMFRTDAGMTMRQLADKLGVPPATVSQVEKGERALKEPKISIWAEALGLREEQLKSLWVEVQFEEDPPIVRRRHVPVTSENLERIVSELTGPERDRVLGYATALIESRLSDVK